MAQGAAEGVNVAYFNNTQSVPWPITTITGTPVHLGTDVQSSNPSLPSALASAIKFKPIPITATENMSAFAAAPRSL